MNAPSSTPLTIADCQDFYDHIHKVHSGLHALGKDLEKFAIRARYTHGDTPNVICTLISMTTHLRVAIEHFETAHLFAADLTYYGTWHPTKPRQSSVKAIQDIREANRERD